MAHHWAGDGVNLGPPRRCHPYEPPLRGASPRPRGNDRLRLTCGASTRHLATKYTEVARHVGCDAHASATHLIASTNESKVHDCSCDPVLRRPLNIPSIANLARPETANYQWIRWRTQRKLSRINANDRTRKIEVSKL
jgi:hypothetical protein